MATGGGRISLPLTVGVDHSHPQWPVLLFFVFLDCWSFFFFFAGDKNGYWGWPDLSPLGRWGGSQPPPVAGSFFGLRWAVGDDVSLLELAVSGGCWVYLVSRIVD